MWLALLVAALLAIGVSDASAAGVIEGTIWSTRADARRASDAHARARATAPPRRSLFDFLGTPSLRRTNTAPASQPATGAPGPAAPTPKPQRDITDAVVMVREIPEAVERRLADRFQRDRRHSLPRMIIRHSRYEPRVMAIAAGSSIEVQNLDRVWHNAFSVSSARRFDLGKLRPGVIDTVALERPGTINLHCDIHPDETGYLVVTPNHAYARPDSLGRFQLPKLPPGRYELEIRHPVRGSRTAVVELPARGDATCDLAF